MIVSEWLRRLWYLIHRRRLERELMEDMEAHRESLGGKRPFGNALLLREKSRDVWGWNWLDNLWRDLSYGAHSLLRARGFTLSAVLVLALGMGVNLAEYQIFDAAVLHHLQVHDLNALARFTRNIGGRWRGSFDPQAVRFYRQYNTSFSSIAEEAAVPAVPSIPGITMDSDPTLLRAAFVSGNYFSALGILPAFGRLLDEQDSTDGAEPVVVLGYGYWERTFGGDSSIINQTIHLNGKPVRIVGVGPYSFSGVDNTNTSIWLPQSLEMYMGGGAGPTRTILIGAPAMFGRLKPGVTFKAADAEFQSLAAQLQKQQPQLFQPRERIQVARIDALPIDYQTVGAVSMLALLVLLVLFASCANLGNMLLARGLARRREIEIRLAIGADHGRIVRQLMTENLLLGSVGAVAAVAFGRTAAEILNYVFAWGPDIRMVTNWQLLSLAALLTLIAVSAFGLLPAFRTVRPRPHHQTRSGKILVSFQVAISCAFLILASLLVRGMLKNLASNASIDYAHMIVVDPTLYLQSLNGATARQGLNDRMSRLRSLSGVDGVTIVYIPPFGNRRWIDKATGSTQQLYLNAVDSSYFDFMRLHFLAGRTLMASEPDSIVVSRAAARSLWPGEDPLGKTLDLHGHSRTVIGVVADSGVNTVAEPTSVEAYIELDDPGAIQQIQHAVLLVHAPTNPDSILGTVRSATIMDGRVPLVSSMNNDLAQQTRGARRLLILIGALSGVATLIAASGIFGLIAFTVSQRTKEIGVRLALGATGSSIVRTVLRQYLAPVCFGLLAGVAVALAGSQILRGARPDIPRFEPLSYTAGLLVFLLIAFVAAFLPCRKALKMEPAAVLRHD